MLDELSIYTIQQLFDEIKKRTETAALVYTIATEEPEKKWQTFYHEFGYKQHLLGLARCYYKRVDKAIASEEVTDIDEDGNND